MGFETVQTGGRAIIAYFCPACLGRAEEGAVICPRCKLTRPPTGWPADPDVGRLLKGKYRLKERLGAGGFGMIYRARQEMGPIDLGEVVLKFLRPEMVANETVRTRFANEAWAARQVCSPHVVKVFDLDFDEHGRPFIVMEHIEGHSLKSLLEGGKLPPARAIGIGLQVAAAMEECHAVGVIHRDLKPDNLLLVDGRADDFVKVIDLGIARVPHGGTTSPQFLGTPRYMSPEQILHQKMDGGVDIFSLGVILYECLTGAPPIEARTQMEYLQLNLNATPVPLRQREPQLPNGLERLLGSMLAKQRADRPSSMADVALRLRAISAEAGWLPDAVAAHLAPTGDLGPRPAAPRRGRRLALGVALAAGLAGLALFGLTRQDREQEAGPTHVATRTIVARRTDPAPTVTAGPASRPALPIARVLAEVPRELARRKPARTRTGAARKRLKTDEWGAVGGGL